MIKCSDLLLFGEIVQIEYAMEPSDIVWENLGHTTNNWL